MTTQTTTQTQTTETKTEAKKIKTILVTRHELLPAQQIALQKAGIEIVEVVPQVPSEITQLQKWCQEVKQRGVEAIVTTALPLHLIPPILQSKLRLFILKMNAIKTTESKEEAQLIVNEKPTHRVILEGRLGEKPTFRVVEFIGLVEIKKVEVVEELVVPA